MKFRAVTPFLILLAALTLLKAQKNIIPTDAFTIEGDVKKEMRIHLNDLGGFEIKSIGDLLITNHLGESKGMAKQLKGILMRDLLSKIEFNAGNPRELSEFCQVFTASDGYRNVYSWNEIFNSPNGDHLYLITEKDGDPLGSMKDRILVICSSDLNTGRRYLKGLNNIRVVRVTGD